MGHVRYVAAEVLKPLEQAADGLGAVLAIEEVGAEVGVLAAIAQHVVVRREHRCGHGEDGSFGAAGAP